MTRTWRIDGDTRPASRRLYWANDFVWQRLGKSDRSPLRGRGRFIVQLAAHDELIAVTEAE
jgi:hypothetical protein